MINVPNLDAVYLDNTIDSFKREEGGSCETTGTKTAMEKKTNHGEGYVRLWCNKNFEEPKGS